MVGEDTPFESQVPVGGDDFEDAPDKETGNGLWAELEERIAEGKAKNDEIEALKAQAMGRACDALGLDPNVGIGKAAAITYDGPPEGLAEFAFDEVGYVATNPMTVEIAIGYRQLDAIAQTAGSVPATEDYSRALAKAEERRDDLTTMAMKSQQVEGWFL